MPRPALVEEEVVTALAVYPVRPQELALATTTLNIFQSKNGGQEWAQCARDGIGLNGQDNH